MPKLLIARPPYDGAEKRQIRKFASARHAPGDCIRRAQMIVHNWQGELSVADGKWFSRDCDTAGKCKDGTEERQKCTLVPEWDHPTMSCCRAPEVWYVRAFATRRSRPRRGG